MSSRQPGRLLLVLAGTVVVAALGAGLWIIGSPGTQREIKIDQRREADIGRLDDAIKGHWRSKGALPANLDQLASRPGVRLAIVDPESGQPYGYRVTGGAAFELCATFTTDSAQLAAARPWANESYPHGIGQTCFEKRAGSNKEDDEEPTP